MTEKLLDFGVFGRWSKKILMEQATQGYDILQAPRVIEHKKDEIQNKIWAIEDKNLRKVKTIAKLLELMEDLEHYKKQMKVYWDIRELILTEQLKLRIKKRKPKKKK